MMAWVAVSLFLGLLLALPGLKIGGGVEKDGTAVADGICRVNG